MYDAVHLADIQEKAEKTLMDVSRFLFSLEVRRYAVKDASTRRYPSPVFTCYLNALEYGVSRDKPDEAKRALELVSSSVRELVAMAASSEVAINDVVATLHQLLAVSSHCAWRRLGSEGAPVAEVSRS